METIISMITWIGYLFGLVVVVWSVFFKKKKQPQGFSKETQTYLDKRMREEELYVRK